MKYRKLIFIVMFIFISAFLYSQNAMQNYFNYSLSISTYSADENELNHSIGTELLFFHSNFINNFGFKYTFGDNIIHIQYSYLPVFDNDIFFEFPLLGVGINTSYNINKNIYSVSPQIHVTLIPSLYFKINLAYRYNINFNHTNSSEIAFTIGLVNLFWAVRQAGV